MTSPQRGKTGKFIPKNPDKYIGNLKNIVFRSSWELRVMRYLDRHPSVLRWASEPFPIPYVHPLDQQIHRYFPDFWVEIQNADGKKHKILVEVKPKSQTRPPTGIGKNSEKKFITWSINQSKWEQAKVVCEQKGWEFKVLTEKEILSKEKA